MRRLKPSKFGAASSWWAWRSLWQLVSCWRCMWVPGLGRLWVGPTWHPNELDPPSMCSGARILHKLRWVVSRWCQHTRFARHEPACEIGLETDISCLLPIVISLRSVPPRSLCFSPVATSPFSWPCHPWKLGGRGHSWAAILNLLYITLSIPPSQKQQKSEHGSLTDESSRSKWRWKRLKLR